MIGTGWVASAGALIYVAAPKELRFCLPNTRFLLHQPAGGAGGTASDIDIEAREILRMRDRLNRIFSRETGQPLERIEEDTHRNFWLERRGRAPLRAGRPDHRARQRPRRVTEATMGLREEFEATGNWLFRRRGYLPLLLFPLLLIAAARSGYPAGTTGSISPGRAAACCWRSPASPSASRRWGSFRATLRAGTPARQQAESLNTSGLYSVVRHPLYLGNYLMWLGVALFPRTWWPPVIVSLVFWLYYERIMFAEEEFLRRKFGTLYTAWAAITPAFLPRLARWRPPAVSFCLADGTAPGALQPAGARSRR